MPDTKPPEVDTAPEIPTTGIESSITDPEIAKAYDAHKVKSPPPSDKAVIADQICQYLTIFRQENVDFADADLQLSHSNKCLFYKHEAYEVATVKGRTTLSAALAADATVKAMSNCVLRMNRALADAPQLADVTEDNQKQVDIKRAIRSLASKAKTKDELASLIQQLLGA